MNSIVLSLDYIIWHLRIFVLKYQHLHKQQIFTSKFSNIFNMFLHEKTTLLQANNIVHYFPYDYYICQMHHVFWLMAHFSSVQTVKRTTVPFNRWWSYLAWITTRTDCHFAQMHMFWRWEWYLFDMHLHLVCMTFMVTLNFLLSIVQHLFSIE